MNKCIFCGSLAKDPTQGLKASNGNDMVVLLIRMMEKDHNGKWTNQLVEVYAFGNYALWLENHLHKDMKIIAVCNVKTRIQPLGVDKKTNKQKMFHRAYFFLSEFFCTESPEKPDYAEEQEDVVFSGALGEVMVDAAAYQQSKVKNDFDYSKPARHYRKLKNYPKDEAEYSAMLDEIVEQNNVEVEKQEEENPPNQ